MSTKQLEEVEETANDKRIIGASNMKDIFMFVDAHPSLFMIT